MAERSEQNPDWAADLQARMMTAVSAQWDVIDKTDDPVILAAAVTKTRAIGVLARTARSVVVLAPDPTRAASRAEAEAEQEADMHDDHPEDPAELHGRACRPALWASLIFSKPRRERPRMLKAILATLKPRRDALVPERLPGEDPAPPAS
ncbi:hypothetical protein CSW58_00615 [Caulobacter sp. B11]|uniref:hypothetical protein n=1 Tax=Caulobacter sp. B11 TaxID=2048899 RepID=UPI000C12A984|nr:hypothetical protein [Caulobacter sp. B11]PHY14241.1 hypothetical protein CSW58_00615 [Caulobacter sp. B11]